MSAVLGGPHSLNSCLKWLHVRFECVFFLDWFETVKLSWKFLEVDCRIEGKDILFYLRFSMEVLALPARLWPEGSEIMSLTVGADRERWVSDSWASFPPCLLCFNTDVQPRTQHGNVTFAFRRYLHWSCVYLALAAEKEARQQKHTRADLNQFKFPQETLGQVWEGGLNCHGRKAWQLEFLFTGQPRRFVSPLDLFVEKVPEFQAPSAAAAAAACRMTDDFLLSRSSLSPAVTFCREAAVTETRKSEQTLVEVTQTVSQTTVNTRRITRCLWHHVGLYNNVLLLISLISFLMRIMVYKVAYLLSPCLQTHFIVIWD